MLRSNVALTPVKTGKNVTSAHSIPFHQFQSSDYRQTVVVPLASGNNPGKGPVHTADSHHLCITLWLCNDVWWRCIFCCHLCGLVRFSGAGRPRLFFKVLRIWWKVSSLSVSIPTKVSSLSASIPTKVSLLSVSTPTLSAVSLASRFVLHRQLLWLGR